MIELKECFNGTNTGNVNCYGNAFGRFKKNSAILVYKSQRMKG